MKKLLMLAALALSTTTLLAQQFSEIRGKLQSDKFKNLALYRVVNGRIDTVSTTTTSPDGSFGFLFKLKDSGFYAIGGSERKVFRLYLKPGDKANIAITDSLINFTGANTKENIALGTWEKDIYKIRKMSQYFFEGNWSYKEMFPELERVYAKSKSFIKSVNTGNKQFDAELAKAVAFDVDYAAIMSILTPRSVHPKEEEYPAVITNIATSSRYSNDDLLRQPYGARLLSAFISLKIKKGDFAHTDFDKHIEQVGGARSKAELVISKAERLKSYKEFEDIETKYAKFITDADQKERMKNIRLRISYKVGAPAYNFTYPNADGKMVSLTDFKGKLVLVDVWATWCGPCKKEIPSMKALEKLYHGKDIVFMSVSVDEKKDHEKWKEFIKTNEMGGVQLYAEGWSKIAKDYRITGIPHFMLFDKNGNIITVDAPRPSSPELKMLIDEYLAK